MGEPVFQGPKHGHFLLLFLFCFLTVSMSAAHVSCYILCCEDSVIDEQT